MLWRALDSGGVRQPSSAAVAGKRPAMRKLVVWCVTSDGEIHLIKLDHSEIEKVRAFYASLHGRGLCCKK